MGKTRTSLSDPLQIVEITVLDGVVGITMCPGKQQPGAFSGHWDRDLDLDLAAIRAWGATDILTLVETSELAALSVEALPAKARALGMRWHHVPIIDGAVPDASARAALDRLFAEFTQRLGAGGRVLVHCKGGLGRAGTVAALLVLACEDAADPRQVIRRVRQARRGAIENSAQEDYVVTWGKPGPDWVYPKAHHAT